MKDFQIFRKDFPLKRAEIVIQLNYTKILFFMEEKYEQTQA